MLKSRVKNHGNCVVLSVSEAQARETSQKSWAPNHGNTVVLGTARGSNTNDNHANSEVFGISEAHIMSQTHANHVVLGTPEALNHSAGIERVGTIPVSEM